MKTISSDAFIRRLTETLHRDLTLVNDNHVWFRSNDLNVMLHVWYEDSFYLCGSRERNSPPGTFVWATSLTPIKQWLVMYNFDLLRACLDLQPFHISFKRLMPAPGWSHRPGTNDYSVELCHDDQPTNIFTGKWAKEKTNLSWFLNHSPERLVEIARIESTEEASQALFGTPHIPFEKE